MTTVWRELASDARPQSFDSALGRWASSVTPHGAFRVFQTESGELALLLRRSDLVASKATAFPFENADCEFTHLAVVLSQNPGDIRGLLRYADAIALAPWSPGADGEDPAGLTQSATVVLRTDSGEIRLGLFTLRSADIMSLNEDAPLNRDPEDLDARADWFKRRRGRD